MIKNLPAAQENWVQSLSQEYSLEKGMATHSSILAWRSPWTEEPDGLQSIEISITSDMHLSATLMAESEEELKSLLMKVKEESEKVGLKLNIQMSDFIFWGSKITANGDCSHEIKRRLLLGRKVMTNLVAYSKAEILLCQQRSI